MLEGESVNRNEDARIAGDPDRRAPVINRQVQAQMSPNKEARTEAPRNGQHYTAANDGKIYNKGEKLVTMMSREGHMGNMRFTSCE